MTNIFSRISLFSILKVIHRSTESLKYYTGIDLKRCYANTIFGCLDENYNIPKDYNRIRYGIESYFVNIPTNIIVLNLLDYISRVIISDVNNVQNSTILGSWFVVCLYGPIIEELLHRLLIRNIIGWILIKCGILPDSKKYKLLIILIPAFIFASLHLSNSGGYLSTRGALIQACSIFIVPTEDIICSRGGLLSSISHHIFNNSVVILSRTLYNLINS